MTYFLRYKVTSTDTIESIAKKHHLDIEDLKEYHNNKSSIYDRILFGIPEHVKEIVLPPKGFTLNNGKEVWDKIYGDKPVHVKLSYSGKFYNTKFIGDLAYAVFKTIETASNKTTIKYHVSIRFYVNDNNKHYVSIDVTSSTYINNEEPDLITDELAISCMKSLYPIVLQLDNDGLLVEIQNHDAILSRWKKQKIINLTYYKGKVAENYFQLFEQALASKSSLLHFLKKDWFFQVYFNKIYAKYTPNYDLESVLSFSILPNTTPVQFTVRQEVDTYLKNQQIKIELKGLCSDPRSRTELENGNYFPAMIHKNPIPVVGKYRALYFLHPRTKKIKAAFLECSLKLEQEKRISISISEIKNNESNRHPDAIIEPKEKKASFFKMLFS